jgi:hypothetical protein
MKWLFLHRPILNKILTCPPQGRHRLSPMTSFRHGCNHGTLIIGDTSTRISMVFILDDQPIPPEHVRTPLDPYAAFFPQ